MSGEALRARPGYPTVWFDAGGGLWFEAAWSGALQGVLRRGAPRRAFTELRDCLDALARAPGAIVRAGGLVTLLDACGEATGTKVLLGWGPIEPGPVTRCLTWWELR